MEAFPSFLCYDLGVMVCTGKWGFVMRESMKKGIRRHLRDFLNCISFVSGGYDPNNIGRGPYIGTRRFEEMERERRRYYDSPLFRN